MQNNVEQDKAIKTIDKNLSVIAGAGTGKTKVLTERFVYILENGDLPQGREVESIVAITFTKKATQEMIERIRKEIRKNFDSGEKWRRYYRDIEKANISTIHSFCLNILKENVIRADLDPMFEVVEEYESRKMLVNSIIEVLEAQLEEDANIYNLLKMMKLDRVNLLIDDIDSIYGEIRTIGMSIRDIKDITINHLESIEAMDISDLDKIRKLVYTLIENGTKAAKIRKVLDDEGCASFLEGGSIGDLNRVLSYINENIGSNKKEQGNIDSLKKYIAKVLGSLERENIVYYKSLFKILEELDLSYKRKKDAFGGLDYEDLQIKTNQLLEDEEILAKYQEKYRYIMIDEFQDTNELQKQIFYKISTIEEDLDRNNLFIVGDPKQSIYGFRGADLDVFYDVANYIDSTNGNISLSLNKNYRTVDTVVAFVNNIFHVLMGKDYGALSSNKISKKEIDIEVIANENLVVPDGVKTSEYERSFEAEQIAKRISELVESGEHKYKDFAMLFRATTRNHIYERALNKYGIPYYNIGSKGFFKQREVLDMINALKSINNINDKVSTIGFLRSNFIGLDDNNIYHILKDPVKDVYNSIEDLIENDKIDKRQIDKLNAALDVYREMAVYKDVYSLNQILHSLLKKTMYVQTTLLKENGRQKFANINKFVEMAKEYEAKHTGNLNEFLGYIDDISENDESLGQIETDNTDAVKMLTIHKSKGLEFPVVIIPEMASRGYSGSSKFLIDEDMGVAINFGKSNPIYNDIKDQKTKKDEEEIERVLYVAMTRAEEKIILGNQGKKSGFKKMIIDILDGQDYKSIKEINVEPKDTAPVKIIPEELVASRLEDDQLKDEKMIMEELPILYNIEDYDRGFNSRVSISKYMIFRDCKRKYFLQDHINVSHIEDIGLESDLELKEKIQSDLSLDYINREIDKDDREINENLEYDIRNIESIKEGAEEIKSSEDNILDPVEKGIVVHEFCELYRDGKDKKEIVKNIIHRKGKTYTEEIYLSLEKYIENYLKHYSEDMDEIYYEKPFFLQLDNGYISGYIDKMTIKDGKVSIMDFKTNKLHNKSRLIKQYTPQIQLYAYVAEKTLGLPIENASILFLENGEVVDIDTDQNALLDNIADVQDFINFTMKNTKIDQYEKTEKCSGYCQYEGICKL